jgi:hypothetical protein
LVTALGHFPIDPDVRSIYPFSNWSLFSARLIAFAQMLQTRPSSIYEYEYLKARFVLVSEIFELLNETLPAITRPSAAHDGFTEMLHWIFVRLFISTAIFFAILSAVIRTRQRAWFSGAELLIRRRLTRDPTLTYFVRDTLLGCEPGYLEEVPLAVLIRNSQGVIEFANQHVTHFSKHTVTQTDGQRFTEFFDEAAPELDFEVTPFANGLEFVVIRDASERRSRIAKYEGLLARLRPQIAPIPQRRALVYVDVRVNSDRIAPEAVFDAFDRAEAARPAVQEIAASATMLRAVCDSGEDAVAVALALMERFGGACKAAVTQGLVTLVSLAEGDALVIACGRSVRRAEYCVTDGVWGRAYVDGAVMGEMGAEAIMDWEGRVGEGVLLEIWGIEVAGCL